ncbi:hypothetical protein PUN28_014388 [Cardiocondyla obscurior]|uniref:Uncharacterized protein n=1 Tax=Cardiocondyla obscurior TaxID=286306 RepID=A0AAW2F324_9HYME
MKVKRSGENRAETQENSYNPDSRLQQTSGIKNRGRGERAEQLIQCRYGENTEESSRGSCIPPLTPISQPASVSCHSLPPDVHLPLHVMEIFQENLRIFKTL